MKKTILVIATLVLGACAKPNNSFPTYAPTTRCYGIDAQKNAYSFIVNRANEQQEVIARYNEQEQHNFFLKDADTYATFNDNVVINASGVYIDGEKVEMEYLCQ
jgi:uncharacterized lipoprotein YajG